MNIFGLFKANLQPVLNWFLKRSLPVKIIIIAAIIVVLRAGVLQFAAKSNQQAQYQTTQAEKGTLIVSVTASGNVAAANSATVDTQASGVIKKVYVQNEQKVRSGDKIAELELDLVGKQRASSAWSSYQSAKNNLSNANINYYALQSDLLTNWKGFMDLAQTSVYENSDKTPNTVNRQLPEFMVTNNDWLSAEAKYKQQEKVVAQTQTALNASWLSYQQSSPVIYAPISGTVTGLSLQIGSVLTAQSNTTGTATSQKIASIQTDAAPIIQINLTQIDTPKVKVGNPATLTFDAFPGKTFTGKVVSIDTIGTVSSGVTTYPAYIKLDTQETDIYSNMTATANLITTTKDNVILVPTKSIQTQNGQSTVRVMRNGIVEEVTVVTGISSDSQIEIVSGLNEGDTVVTGSTAQGLGTGQQNTQTQSPFSPFGGRGLGGAGNVRIVR